MDIPPFPSNPAEDLNATDPAPPDCRIVELRQYTLHAGRRDTLVELFDREFVETQEAVGMHVMGQFRDLDDADRFVWLRGFAGMAARLQGLQAFYGGPVWARHRAAANATMVDSDDVRLLRPAWPGSGLQWRPGDRAATGATAWPAGVLLALVLPLSAPADEALLDLARGPMACALREGGARAFGGYVTEPSTNDFPRLPVREGEPVLAVLALFPRAEKLSSFLGGRAWRQEVLPSFTPWLSGPVQTLRLAPTARSALHA